VTKNYPTLHKIIDAHGWKRDYEKYLPLSRFVFRPVGFLFTWVAIRIGLTTEAVAWLSGVIGIAACVCLASGHESLLPVGISLLLFFNLLDCVDGSIARSMKTENPYGRFLDAICGGVVYQAFWGIIGIMAFRHPQHLLFPNPFGLSSLFWLMIGGLTCFFCIWVGYTERTFDELLRPHWDKLQVANRDGEVTAPDPVKVQSVANPSQTLVWRTITRTINTNLRVQETHYLLLVLAFYTRTIDLFLASFLSYYFLQEIVLIIIYSRRGKLIKRSFY